MLSIYRKSIFKPIKQYLLIYKPLFYKRSFNNFMLLICAFLAIQEVRSIKFIYEKFIKKYFNVCLNRFYYFLADEGLDLNKLMCCTVKKALSLIPSNMTSQITIYLIVDDTLQPKFGQHFESCGKLFDHANHDGQPYINGHCFVSLAMSIPIIIGTHIKYITIPVGCKLYDKTQTKLELAAEMIETVASELTEYQVIVLCDAWYTKKSFSSEIFSSVRLYICTIPLERINSFTLKQEQGMNLENKPKATNVFQVFRMRWPIEVMFYQEKNFWSFGKYMVRSKTSIEKYAYLVGVTYTLITLLPFIDSDFSEYQFQSPQEVKYSLGAELHREFILSNLLETLQKSENPITLEGLIDNNELKDLG